MCRCFSKANAPNKAASRLPLALWIEPRGVTNYRRRTPAQQHAIQAKQAAYRPAANRQESGLIRPQVQQAQQIDPGRRLVAIGVLRILPALLRLPLARRLAKMGRHRRQLALDW